MRPRGLSQHDCGQSLSHLAGIDRLELPVKGDKGQTRQQREGPQIDLHEIVELSGTKNRPGDVAVAHQRFSCHLKTRPRLQVTWDRVDLSVLFATEDPDVMS